MSMGTFIPEAEGQSADKPSGAMGGVNTTPPHGRLRTVGAVLESAIDKLLSQQMDEGHWCAELEGDSILQSEYILLQFIIEQEFDERLPKIANYLRRQQRVEDGAWVQYPGAKPDLNATVKAYFALKLMGDDIESPHMVKARRVGAIVRRRRAL